MSSVGVSPALEMATDMHVSVTLLATVLTTTTQCVAQMAMIMLTVVSCWWQHATKIKPSLLPKMDFAKSVRVTLFP